MLSTHLACRVHAAARRHMPHLFAPCVQGQDGGLHSRNPANPLRPAQLLARAAGGDAPNRSLSGCSQPVSRIHIPNAVVLKMHASFVAFVEPRARAGLGA